MEELENQSEVIFDHASDLVFESLSEIGSIIPATAHEKVRKHGSVRLLEITNRLLHHNACFLKLFSYFITIFHTNGILGINMRVTISNNWYFTFSSKYSS